MSKDNILLRSATLFIQNIFRLQTELAMISTIVTKQRFITTICFLFLTITCRGDIWLNDLQVKSPHISSNMQKRALSWKQSQRPQFIKQLAVQLDEQLSHIASRADECPSHRIHLFFHVLSNNFHLSTRSIRSLLVTLHLDGNIDDIIWKFLNDILDAWSYQVSMPSYSENLYNNSAVLTDQFFTILASLESNNQFCVDRHITGHVPKNFSKVALRNQLSAAVLQGKLRYSTYAQILTGFRGNHHLWQKDLHQYLLQKSSLRRQRPGNKSAKHSEDMIEIDRWQLFQGFSTMQIIHLESILQRMNKRIHAHSVDIVVHDHDATTIETITLSAMEQFRFATRALNVEMATISNHPQFRNHRQLSYHHIVMAAYETKLINQAEYQVLRDLESMWKQTRSTWEIAQSWLSLVATVSVVTIPAPYGFIPTLALIIINGIITENKRGELSRDHSLF